MRGGLKKKHLLIVEGLQKVHEAKYERLQTTLAEYKKIAESHTITWKGFEPDTYTEVLSKTLVLPGYPLEQEVARLLAPYAHEEVRVTFSVGVKGNWAARLQKVHGWGIADTGKVSWPSYWSNTQVEGTSSVILSTLQGALRVKEFWTPAKDGAPAFYDLADNLHLQIKIEKKVPRVHPKPKVEVVEVKVALPQELPFIDRHQREEEEKRAERAALIAAELEVDPDLRNAVLQAQTRVRQ
jgi:hypothetical protein